MARADSGVVAAGGSPSRPIRKGVIFATVSIALLMSSIDSTIVATALHTLQEEFDASISLTGWVITINAIAQLIAFPVTGRLCVQYGRRPVILVSIVTFLVASLLCGFSTNMYMLIAMRAVQAVGGAGITPAATGVIVDHFGASRDRAVALFSSVMSIGTVMGPVLGGILIEAWSWHSIFFVNVPTGIILVLLTLRFIPNDRKRGVSRRTDWLGIFLLALGTTLTTVAVSYLGEQSAQILSWQFLVPMIAGITASVVFIRRIHIVRNPLISPKFVHGNGFGSLNYINLLFGAATSGIGALIPLYATLRYGIGVLGSGTLLTGRGVAMAVCAALATMVLRRSGYRNPIMTGLIATGLGMVALSLPALFGSPYQWLAIAAGLTGAGMGWSNPATRNSSLQSFPDEASEIAALRTMSRRVGSIISIAIATAIIGHSSDPSGAATLVFLVFGLLLLVSIVVVRNVPEHRGSW